jgi:hypothetical protein
MDSKELEKLLYLFPGSALAVVQNKLEPDNKIPAPKAKTRVAKKKLVDAIIALVEQKKHEGAEIASQTTIRRGLKDDFQGKRYHNSSTIVLPSNVSKDTIKKRAITFIEQTIAEKEVLLFTIGKASAITPFDGAYQRWKDTYSHPEKVADLVGSLRCVISRYNINA